MGMMYTGYLLGTLDGNMSGQQGLERPIPRGLETRCLPEVADPHLTQINISTFPKAEFVSRLPPSRPVKQSWTEITYLIRLSSPVARLRF